MGTPKDYEGFVGETLVELKNYKTSYAKLNLMATRFPGVFTELVKSWGYNGGGAIYEGGEPAHWEDHESWVIFDPAKVKIFQSHGVSR